MGKLHPAKHPFANNSIVRQTDYLKIGCQYLVHMLTQALTKYTMYTKSASGAEMQ